MPAAPSKVSPSPRKLLKKDLAATRARLHKKQKGICPICQRPIQSPVLDHDHATGAVREVLCRNCNRFEGKVLRWANSVPTENILLLASLAKYWIKHKVNRTKLIHPLHGVPKKRRKKKKSG